MRNITISSLHNLCNHDVSFTHQYDISISRNAKIKRLRLKRWTRATWPCKEGKAVDASRTFNIKESLKFRIRLFIVSIQFNFTNYIYNS